jgi:hypothetical protein
MAFAELRRQFGRIEDGKCSTPEPNHLDLIAEKEDDGVQVLSTGLPL